MENARFARQRRRMILYEKRHKRQWHGGVSNQGSISFLSHMTFVRQITFANMGYRNGSIEAWINRRMAMARLKSKRKKNANGNLEKCTETQSNSVFHEPGHGQPVITLDNSLHLAGQSSNICATRGLLVNLLHCAYFFLKHSYFETKTLFFFFFSLTFFRR
jgi:hypothetical protein